MTCAKNRTLNCTQCNRKWVFFLEKIYWILFPDRATALLNSYHLTESLSQEDIQNRFKFFPSFFFFSRHFHILSRKQRPACPDLISDWTCFAYLMLLMHLYVGATMWRSLIETKMEQSLTPYQFLSTVNLPFIRMEDRPEIPSDLLLTWNEIQIYNRNKCESQTIWIKW